jgi:putative ABC transport system ATP-binding protein
MLIELSDITLSFGESKVFSGFSLSLAEGERLLLRGRSGAGKSTVLRLIMGFVRPQKGLVLIDKKPLDERLARSLRRKIAYVPQETVMPQNITAREFVAEIMQYKANLSKASFEVFLSSLERLKVDEKKLDEPSGKLSGGEKQRILVACAIMMNRNTFLLDEPTSALDAESKKIMIEIFTENPDWSVLTVSHDTAWLDYPKWRVMELNDKKDRE